jgi:hypothetical protein
VHAMLFLVQCISLFLCPVHAMLFLPSAMPCPVHALPVLI